MGACLATPRDDAADALTAPAGDPGPLDAVERRKDPALVFAGASRLKLRMAAAAKEARGARFRYNGGVVDGTDAGVVELAISRVKIDDTRAVTAALDANDPLLVTLFHKRGEDRDGASDDDGEEEDDDVRKPTTTNISPNVARRQKTARWVSIGVAECFPDGTKNGELLTHFRERARRELSRHKAPVFALPSDLRFGESQEYDKTLRVVVAKIKNARRASRDGNDVSDEHDAHSGSPDNSPTQSFDLATVDRSRYRHYARSKQPPSRSRARPAALGSATFSLADVLTDDRRAKRTPLITHDRLPGFGPVASRSGEIVVRVTSQNISREWAQSSKVRTQTPPGALSFERLLMRFEDVFRRDAEKRKAPETSWALEGKKAVEAREDARVEARDEARLSRNARGRTYASANGRASRTRGGGSRRRADDPGFDDENLWNAEVPNVSFAAGGLGGRAEGYV